MVTCNTCHGAGTLATGRYEDCYRCGGSGQGAAMNVPCASCGGGGKTSREVRDTCWGCGGGGVVADPNPPRATPRAATRPTSAPARPAAKKHPTAAGSANTTSGPIAGVATLAAVGYALYRRLHDGAEWPNAVLMGGVAFVACLLGLHLLVAVLRFAMQAAKVAVPLAILLAIGNHLGWSWAQGTTTLLHNAWRAVADLAHHAWHAI